MTLKKIIPPVLYRELRYAYRQYFVFWHPLQYWRYLYLRLFVRPRIRFVSAPFDRAPGSAGYSVHILCSHGDLDLLLWSLASWHRVVPNSGRVFIHEDGSFTARDRQLIGRLLPHAAVVDFAWATREAHDEWLQGMPAARALRDNYAKHILIVKLVDPRFVSDAPKRLILDSDMLWFEEPTELLGHLENYTQPFFQYGGPTGEEFRFADNSLLAASLHELNSGIVGYATGDFSLSDLEQYALKADPKKHRHFIEQSGYAWVLDRAGKGIRTLDRRAYTVREPVESGVVLKHYTGPRREQMTLEGMRILKPHLLS